MSMLRARQAKDRKGEIKKVMQCKRKDVDGDVNADVRCLAKRMTPKKEMGGMVMLLCGCWSG